MNDPQKRYSSHLQNFNKKLELSIKEHHNSPLINIGRALHANDGRTPFFQLQGLARIDSKIGKSKKRAEKWILDFKEIEDAIGKFDYWDAMITNNKRWKFPSEVSNYFENQAYFCLGVMEDRLVNAGWLSSSPDGLKYSPEAYDSFNKSFKKLESYGSEKERKKLLELFRDELFEINVKVKSKEIDLNNLEFGIHEFRRKLRWMGIYCSALLGKVKIDISRKNLPLNHFVTKERASFKFNQLPVNEQQEFPIYYLRGGFYAMSDLIKIIGDIKDPGLATEEMLRIGKFLGINESVIKKHLGKEFYPHTKVVKDARDLINNYLLKDKILLHSADHFDKQIK